MSSLDAIRFELIHRVPMLDDTNYYIWNVRMEACLVLLGHWDVVTGGEESPAIPEGKNVPDADLKEAKERVRAWAARDREARAIITSRLGDDQLVNALACRPESAQALWDALRKIHAETDKGTKKLKIFQEMRERKYVEGTSMREHTNAFFADAVKLRTLGTYVDDFIIAAMMIGSVDDDPHLEKLLENELRSLKEGEQLSPHDVQSLLSLHQEMRGLGRKKREEPVGKSLGGKSAQEMKNKAGTAPTVDAAEDHENGDQASECSSTESADTAVDVAA